MLRRPNESAARSVQICTNLQPDYYMKYYRMLVVQTGSSVIKRCDRPGIGRRQQRECHAMGAFAFAEPSVANVVVGGLTPVAEDFQMVRTHRPHP